MVVGSNQYRWQIISGFELRWLNWDDEFVVYHTGSGDTHLLNSMAAIILEQMASSSLSLQELSDYFIHSLGINPDNDFEKNLKQLVTELERSGLIERTLS